MICVFRFHFPCFDFAKIQIFFKPTKTINLPSKRGQFPHRFFFCLIKQVGIYFSGAYVRMAHELLYRVDWYVFCQEQHTERVASNVERYPFPHFCFFAPPLQDIIHLLVCLFFKHSLPCSLQTAQKRFRFCA